MRPAPELLPFIARSVLCLGLLRLGLAWAVRIGLLSWPWACGLLRRLLPDDEAWWPPMPFPFAVGVCGWGCPVPLLRMPWLCVSLPFVFGSPVRCPLSWACVLRPLSSAASSVRAVCQQLQQQRGRGTPGGDSAPAGRHRLPLRVFSSLKDPFLKSQKSKKGVI